MFFCWPKIELFAFLDFQDSPDPLANSPVQPQFPGTLVLELDWLHLRSHNNDPLVLCIAGADSSFRLVEVIVYVSYYVQFDIFYMSSMKIL